ncbi:hypothetical protein GBF38_022145 [Nibea albiflora]|uniref:Uncharacterized protein n=1 Tax=Nibea albiflora TaxID=240163 RepID=A0ACB7FHN5_NIBAL|nr:hypothetical protein GBF38_022145 [Nibea albiflora]
MMLNCLLEEEEEVVEEEVVVVVMLDLIFEKVFLSSGPYVDEVLIPEDLTVQFARPGKVVTDSFVSKENAAKGTFSLAEENHNQFDVCFYSRSPMGD